MTNKYFRVALGVLATMLLATTASANLLSDAGFDAVNTSGGDVNCNGAGVWSCFNNAFYSSQAILPRGGTGNAVKQWGVDGGTFQDVAVTAGTTYDASVYAANWNGDLMQGTGVFQIQWLDGNDILIPGIPEVRCGVVGSGEACELAGVDGGNDAMWTFLSLPGIVAPTGAVTARFFLLHLDGGGGSIFWDDASFTAQVVPIPGALLLMGPALLGLMGLRRKRA